MRRRGYILVEVFVACTILAALFALVIQMVSTTARERRSTERRAIGLEQAANLLERAHAIPFDKLSAETLREVALPDDAGELLPESEVGWTVADEESEVPAKRVQVELKWRAHGRQDAQVRLVTWAFPDSAEALAADAAPREAPSEPTPAAVEDPS